MKIRSITLSDVRQFTRPVTISGFDSGLNVLSAPNEAGKSTLFDAIHAVFFTPHRSSKIASLKPAVGGNPEIALELDLPTGPHRILKRWGKGATAEVWAGARLIAKADDAEAFIAGLTTPADEGGPAGLLWVRQGVTALDQGSKKETEAAHAARRDLMSSVTGEFESLTGGRRMDRALAQARAGLDQLVTLRGPKAGGPLDRVCKLVETLEAQHKALSATAQTLHDALKRRRAVLAELADLTDPEAIAARARRLAEATEGQTRAERHAAALDQAKTTLASARLHHGHAKAALDRLTAAETTLTESVKLQTPALAAAREALVADTAARTALADCESRTNAAHTALQQAEAALQAALRGQAMVAKARQRAELTLRQTEAETLIATLATTRAAAQSGPDRKILDTLEQAQTGLAYLERLTESTAPHLMMTYLPGVPVLADTGGTPLQDGVALPVLSEMAIALPGLGRLTLIPGVAVADRAKTDAARATLARLLAQSGCASLEAARDAAQTRRMAEDDLRDLQARLRILAPDGTDALKSDIAALGLPGLAILVDAPDPDTAQTLVAQAQSALAVATQAGDRARLLGEDAREKAIRAELAQDAAQRDYLRAEAVLAEFGSRETARAALLDTLHAAETALVKAQTDHDGIARNAPDLAASLAALQRAKSVVTSADAETKRLSKDHAVLETQIEIHAGNGVEEDLADIGLQLKSARIEKAAQDHEVAVLRCLIAALDQAQSAARDRYLAPVMTELKPMLRLLWPDAELLFDGGSLLPTALVRDGKTEDIGTLSGGTREQIALLVRLAFARLLARSGRHAPVILDDALVYTDDDRIERMFDALHAQASDLQIIVLSCRNRAFRDLGGQKLSFQPMDAAGLPD